MANLSRTSKYGNDWTRAELDAYNIVIEEQDVLTFFETMDPLPKPTVHDDFLTIVEAEEAEDLDTCRTLAAMDLAMSPHPAEESAVDDFTVRLFDILGYNQTHLLAYQKGRSPPYLRRIQTRKD